MAAQENKQDSRSTTTSSRVDHPVGKAQWMDKEVTDGRVDHPIGKAQWMDADDAGSAENVVTPPTPVVNRPSQSGGRRPSSQATQVTEPQAEKDSITISFTLSVLSYGRNKGTVDEILSEMSGGRTVTVPITFKYQLSGFSMAVKFAQRLMAVDAKIELKQQITKEIPLIIRGM